MYSDDGSALRTSVSFDARRAEHMSTAESMFWGFEVATPANGTILETNSCTFGSRLREEVQKVVSIHLYGGNLLRLSITGIVSQLVEEMLKTVVNFSSELFVIILE